MLKKILLDLVGGTIFSLILMYLAFDWDFMNPINLSNSVFITGVVMFSAGLLTVTNATKIFRGIGFVFKRMFTRKVEGMSYYEYILMKDDKQDRLLGFPLFITGLAFIIAALILGS
ncbi:MAG: DUF3899 domain-containing protein [Candidatus Izemoplasmatales bacterium]|jgi:hypothetical protein|nr:DUF3899 domain-containing protein [Candidatus Izemoplasmatales bacterium]